MERYTAEWREVYYPKVDWWNSLTPEQIEGLLQSEYTSAYAANHPEYEIDPDDPEPLDWNELGELFEPETYGPLRVVVLENRGGEGQGDTMTLVFSLVYTDPELGTIGSRRFFEKTGWYQSYAGSEWDGDLVEVTPEEEIVTVWRRK